MHDTDTEGKCRKTKTAKVALSPDGDAVIRWHKNSTKGGMQREVVEAKPHREGFGCKDFFLKPDLLSSMKNCFAYYNKIGAWMPDKNGA